MALIHLTIVSPQGKFYEADAQRVMVRTTGGEVDGGLLHVASDQVQVITDHFAWKDA